MSRAILISIKPEWCEFIVSGCKTIEVRKTRPKLETPFKCYIYCTLPKSSGDICLIRRESPVQGNGKVIGEFICYGVIPLFNIATDDWKYLKGGIHEGHKRLVTECACMTEKELHEYANGKFRYAREIENLVIYDKPKELSEFHNCSCCEYAGVCNDECWSGIKRPPQSWCYVEELDNV